MNGLKDAAARPLIMRMLTGIAACLAAAVLAVAPAAGAPRPVAVIGDSDSHSYHDELNGIRRGGANNAATLNWLEVWARLAPDEIDPGPFGLAGESHALAYLRTAFGAPAQAPRKRDFLYNYAWSGARCASLSRAWPEQRRWLIARLKADRARWDEGLIVIRIGVNDFAQPAHLGLIARNVDARRAEIDACLADIEAAVAAIRRVSRASIALVGVAHDYDTPFAGPDIVPEEALARVNAALDRFDRALAALAAADPRIAFVDDVGWFRARFGGRMTGDLKPSAAVAGVEVRNAPGDAPQFLHTADGHPGTIAAGLFLQSMIGILNEQLGWSLTAPTDAEIVALARG
jgi:hypothetical protein